MEPMKLHFDIRDVFRAPRLALSGKKIWVFLVANVIGYLVYFILNYLAFSLSGVSMSETWSTRGLYPCLFGTTAPWYAWALFWIGSLFWFFAILLACTAVARITYKQLKGDEFFSAGDAWKFLKKHWHPVIFTSISIVLILVFFVVMAAIFALFGKIPYVGEFLFVLPYLLYFFGSVFTLYTGIVLIMSIIYTPAIVATIEEDTMGAVFNSYSVTWSQPWRIVLYHSVLIPLFFLAVAIFKGFWFGAIWLINVVFGHSALMGEKLANIVGTAGRVVWPEQLVNLSNTCCTTKPLSDVCCSTTNIFCCNVTDWYQGMVPKSSASLSGTESVAAFILGIFLFLLVLSVLSYALAVFSVGETLMFTIFRKKTDDDNVLERKDEDELEAENEDDEDLEVDTDEEEDEDTDDDDASTETDDASSDDEPDDSESDQDKSD
jgi:hypothetical protein